MGVLRTAPAPLEPTLVLGALGGMGVGAKRWRRPLARALDGDALLLLYYYYYYYNYYDYYYDYYYCTVVLLLPLLLLYDV